MPSDFDIPKPQNTQNDGPVQNHFTEFHFWWTLFSIVPQREECCSAKRYHAFCVGAILLLAEMPFWRFAAGFQHPFGSTSAPKCVLTFTSLPYTNEVHMVHVHHFVPFKVIHTYPNMSSRAYVVVPKVHTKMEQKGTNKHSSRCRPCVRSASGLTMYSILCGVYKI